MKFLYKTVMFLMLMLFCVGSVCATDPDNTTSDNVTGDGGLSPVNSPINNTTDVSNEPVGHIMTDKEKFEFMDGLYRNNTALNKKVKTLNEKINKQGVEIKYLNDTLNLVLEDNKQLKEDNKALKEDIKELNIKLDLQLNEIKGLQADKDKLNAEIKQIYEKLLNSPKKEDFDQLKKEIDNKNKQIDKLNNEINTLRAIISVNGKDVYNSLKGLSSTKNIKCGKYTFKLEDYLKIPLIKDGKDRVFKYKKDNGRLPQYVTIAGYKVPKNIYQKLFDI